MESKKELKEEIRELKHLLGKEKEKNYSLYQEIEDLETESIPEQFDCCGIKGEVLRDLARNCSVEELEALEMLMRIKKESDYRALRDGLPHEDHINFGRLFKGNREISVKNYCLL